MNNAKLRFIVDNNTIDFMLNDLKPLVHGFFIDTKTNYIGHLKENKIKIFKTTSSEKNIIHLPESAIGCLTIPQIKELGNVVDKTIGCYSWENNPFISGVFKGNNVYYDELKKILNLK